MKIKEETIVRTINIYKNNTYIYVSIMFCKLVSFLGSTMGKYLIRRGRKM